MEGITDLHLLERCLNGDEAAWSEIVRRYQKLIYNLAYRFSGRFDQAEELTQEIFLKIYRSLKKFTSQRGEFKGWMTVMARNYLIDYLRRERKRWNQYGGTEELEKLEYDTNELSPLGHVERQEKIRFVHNCLRELSPDLQESLILRELEGLSYEEIAVNLDVPLGTVKSRINRGRIELARVANMKRLSLMSQTDHRLKAEEAL